MASNDMVWVLSDKRLLSARMSPLLFVTIFLAVTALPMVYLATLIFPDASWFQLFAKLPELLDRIDWARVDWGGTLFRLALIGAVFGHIWHLHRAQKLERLTLSPDGIRYTSPLPPFLKQFKPDWFLSWSQMSKGELGTLNGRLVNSTLAQLTFFTSAEQRRISPAVWVDAQKYRRPVTRFKLTLTPMTQSQDEILKMVTDSEVMRYISRNVPHLTITSTLGKAETSASLEKNPHGRIAIGIVFILMAYAFFDFTLGPESYIDEPSSLLHIYIAAGILGAILSGAWLHKSTLALAEKIGLAMLIGVLVAVAMIPGALRINALTDTNSNSTYEYFVTQSADGVVLRPVVDGMPNIDYFAKNRFWERFEKNATYPVQIHKGSLGFYQFNSSAIINDIHSHESN